MFFAIEWKTSNDRRWLTVFFVRVETWLLPPFLFQFIRFLVYCIEDSLRNFLLPALRDDEREVLVQILVCFCQLRRQRHSSFTHSVISGKQLHLKVIKIISFQDYWSFLTYLTEGSSVASSPFYTRHYTLKREIWPQLLFLTSLVSLDFNSE